MVKTLRQTIDKIIEVEGGYTNNPDDSGGETNFGITIDVARRWGYDGRMADLPRSIAFDIYKSRYWDIINLGEISKLSEKIADEMLDTGVNMGVRVSAKFLQRALNVFNQKGVLYPDLITDGFIGSVTILALREYLEHRGDDGETVMHKALNSQQGARYISIAAKHEKNETFIYGWFLNRVS